MGANRLLPSISEVAAFLESAAPSVADQLERRGPAYSKVLHGGMDLGLGDAQQQQDNDLISVGLRVRAEVLSAALDPMVERARKQIEVIDTKLRKLAFLKFISGVAATLAAPGSILSLILVEVAVAIFLSALSFLVSLVQLFADTLILGPGKKETDLIESSRVMSSSITYGQLASSTLAALITANASATDIEEMLKEANQQFGLLNDVLSDTGLGRVIN